MIATGSIADAPSLGAVLEEACGKSDPIGRVVGEEMIKKKVHRLLLDVRGRPGSLVLKRMEPVVAQRNELLLTRWLPAIGLSEIGPRLFGVAAERSGDGIWHVYEDVGEGRLDRADDPERVTAAVELIARLHTTATGHFLLPECRHYGGDRGIDYFTSNVRDAIHGLECLCPPAVDLSHDDLRLRDGLIARLRALLAEAPRRAASMATLGGPNTLLHGDLWTKNVFVSPGENGLRAQLIDWDHVAVGPFSYDLSTLLYRFPPSERPWIFERYERAVHRAGWHLPAPSALNDLFETAECARYANRIIWPAVALRLDGAPWAFVELGEIMEWFETLEPALPT